MQPVVKIQNKSTPWNDKLRPRVGDTVLDGGMYYSNIAGYNGVTSDTTIWFPTGVGQAIAPLTAGAGQVSGSDPFYSLDLSTFNVPALPSNLLVYVDLNGDGNFQTLDPVSYNASTKIISGMNSPTDYPDQIIKVFIS